MMPNTTHIATDARDVSENDALTQVSKYSTSCASFMLRWHCHHLGFMILQADCKWVGTAPACRGSPTDCVAIGPYYWTWSKCGDGAYCTSGLKVYCCTTPSPYIVSFTGRELPRFALVRAAIVSKMIVYCQITVVTGLSVG